MRVLCLDQATHTGYAVLDRDDATGHTVCRAFGTWDCSSKVRRKKTDPKKGKLEGAYSDTLSSLFGRLVLTSDAFQVDWVVVEDIYPGSSLQTLTPLMEVRALVKLVAAIKNINYAHYRPQTARSAFGLSTGDEGKPQAAQLARRLFPQIPESEPFDTTDAVLLGLYHLNQHPLGVAEGTDIFSDVG